jgi:hypothetical protein
MLTKAESQRRGFALALQAYGCLVMTHFALRTGGFPRLHRFVKRWQVRNGRKGDRNSLHYLMGALENACAFYLIPVLCLQYAASAVCLLRLHGEPAELVIGISQNPFSSHAWVELNGVIVAGSDSKQSRLVVIDRV